MRTKKGAVIFRSTVNLSMGHIDRIEELAVHYQGGAGEFPLTKTEVIRRAIDNEWQRMKRRKG